jgi:hypothetical protein
MIFSMGINTASETGVGTLRDTWGAGIAGGIIGGIGMGIIFHLGANVMPFIGSVYGWPTVIGGWVVHLANSVLFALVFTLLVTRPFVREQMTTLSGCVIAGVFYAAAVGLVNTGVVLPIAMNTLDVQSLPEPVFPVPDAVGAVIVITSIGVAHMVYGLLLGATYGSIHVSDRDVEIIE